MKQVLAPVVENREVAQETYLLRLRAPEIARHARPGQFVHVRCTPVAEATSISGWPESEAEPLPRPLSASERGHLSTPFPRREGGRGVRLTDPRGGRPGQPAWDPLLRRPLSVLWTRRQNGEFEVLYDVVGRGTAFLSRVRPGDTLDVLGPLGRPFELAGKSRHVLLVGGGVGLVPLVALAEEALARDVSATLVAGFRTAARVLPAELLPPELEYVVATDDGSAGRPGLVTEAVGEYLPWTDQLFACGPLAMLKALARLPLPGSLSVQISIEEHMGCAMGVCLGCVVPTKRGLRRVCRDGPVFDLREMDW